MLPVLDFHEICLRLTKCIVMAYCWELEISIFAIEFDSFVNFREKRRGGTSFILFAMPLHETVYMCLVVTCLERADIMALVCDVLL